MIDPIVIRIARFGQDIVQIYLADELFVEVTRQRPWDGSDEKHWTAPGVSSDVSLETVLYQAISKQSSLMAAKLSTTIVARLNTASSAQETESFSLLREIRDLLKGSSESD